MRRRGDDDDNGWKEWGGYMRAKIQKLQDQYLQEAPELVGNVKKTQIFTGVAIFVNGLTDPNADDLRRLMAIHGGIYHHYYEKTATTHIIASNLAQSKIKNISKEHKIVTPKWITESITAGKLLPYQPYLLYTQATKNQPALNFKPDGEIESKIELRPTKSAIDAKDSKFISEFYNHSRLHLISTLAAELKQHVTNLRSESNGIFEGYEKIDNWRKSADLSEQKIGNESVVMHIDMDCFFVSVGLRKRPDLIGKPVAVAHSKGVSTNTKNAETRKYEKQYYKQHRMINSKHSASKADVDDENNPEDTNWWEIEVEDKAEFLSCSEIASCSYEARKCGIKNGLFLGEAKKLCPNLQIIPYDFEGYRQVSYTLYNTVASYTLNIEAVSCDELYVDCTEILKEAKISASTFAEILRSEIKEKTGCCCSTGIACNMLLARLATRKAKPNGQFLLQNEYIESFLKGESVRDLPGVGWSLSSRLNALKIKTCGDLQKISFLTLQSEFGVKTGQMLHEMCRGIDGRKIKTDQVRKSVSAEVNYGIRFNQKSDADKFLTELSEEVAKRLAEVGMKGKTITLKLKIRKKDAPLESSKFMGHGICDSISRSTSLKTATDDSKIIAQQVQNLLQSLKLPVSDLRGIGIQMQKLEKINQDSNNLFKYLNNPESSKEQESKPITKPKQLKNEPEIQGTDVALPPPSQVDLAVLAELPEEVRLQICKDYETRGVKLIPTETTNETKTRKSHETVSNIDTGGDHSIEETLCSQTELHVVKELISEWVDTSTDPGSEDVSMLTVYLKNLIADKNLERVCIVLNFLRRLMLKSNSNRWSTAFGIICEDVQSFMISMYGAPLKL